MQRNSSERGQVLLMGLVFLGIMFGAFAGISDSITQFARSERHTIASEQALALAEAGIDEAAYQLNQGSSYAGESNTSLGSGTYTVSVTSIDGSTKRVTSTGYVPNASSPVATRTVKATLSINANIVAFRYGVQAGDGGFSLSGGATINGNVYSNGNINAVTGVHITGSATAANQPATTTDQANDTPLPISSCTSSTCITFANASASQDFAQSFQISSAVGLNSVQFYIKKVGTPSDATVRMVNDNGGSPGTDVLMTGTLSASSVTTSFGWVKVTLPSTPVLNPGQTYWMVIDAGSNASKYYIIGANSGGYANGVAKIGQYGSTWSATSPAGLDGYFELYLGGGTSMIGGNSYSTGVYVGTTGSDNAWAHTVMGATVSGTLYCQTSSFTNKSCTSSSDPSPQPMPLSDGNIQDWENNAVSGGVLNGNQTVGFAGASLGPKKIVGNLTVNGGGTLDVTGTLWVTGTITVTGGGKVKLDASYGSNDGALVSDGIVTVNGGGTFAGSGTTGSYPFLITTSACPTEPGCNGADAVTLSGGAGTVAIVAQNGNVHVSGGSALKALTAKQITMDGGASLQYDSGLVNSNFSSGPGASWSMVPGTYVITQ